MDVRNAPKTPAWLVEFLAPVPPVEFLSKYWLKERLFCRGRTDRFAGLLSWSEINDLMEHHWRETYRFRLARQGRDLDPSTYADLDGFTPRIRSRDLTDHLRRGATFSFDAIDELHPPLTRLAESFEAFFHGGTKINIYAAWRALHGLDLHRDDQEIFILQLDGRKRWLLYGVSIEHVDRTGLSRGSEPPPGAVMDEVLQPGDLLYIPRGCYHLAVPMNEPTLHLTLGVKNPRGIDLMRWMVERLHDHSVAGRDLPIVVAPDERVRFSEQLCRVLVEGLQPDLVDQYLAETGSNLKPRPSFSLPWSATRDLLPSGREFTLKLNGRADIIGGRRDGVPLELLCDGRRFRFPGAMRRVIDALKERSAMPVSDVIESVAPHLNEEAVRLLLGMLLKDGLIAIRA